MTLRAALVASVWLGAPFALAATPVADQPAPPVPAAPVIYTAVVDGIIHPVSAEYMIQTMDQADRAGAALVVFTLRTPGGLVDSTRDIVTRMLAAKTPGRHLRRPGGRARRVCRLHSDHRRRCRGDGAGHPHRRRASGRGRRRAGRTRRWRRRPAADVAAYARTLADGRRRNVTLAEQAVNESRAFTEREALAAVATARSIWWPRTCRTCCASSTGARSRRFDNTTVTLDRRRAPRSSRSR